MLKRLFFVLYLLPMLVIAQYPQQPSNYITDDAGVLSQEQQNLLNKRLHVFEDSTTNKVFVYIAKSLNGQDLESLSQEIFHNWKIGKEGKNNGVLISIFIDDHKFRIHTGYGMEGALPDLLTKRIQDEYMRPHFKENNYYEGINAGIDELIFYTKNGSLSSSEIQPQQEEGGWSWFLAYVFNALLLILFFVLKRKSNKSKTTKTILSVIAVILFVIPCIGSFILFFLCVIISNKSKFNWRSGSTNGSSSDSSWSSSDSSWSSSDSSSDSGFDGGGGDSGGGGSSSDW